MYSNFEGSSILTVDAKGRIAIPKKYHEILYSESSGQLALALSVIDECITVLTGKRWEKVKKQIIESNTNNASSRVVRRIWLGTSRIVDLDSAGRILIPKELRVKALIGNKAILAGNGKSLDLWNEKLFDDFISNGRTTIRDSDEAQAYLATLDY